MLRKLYVLDATLLTLHEIDSAYWREWDLFHLPGGAGAFLALHAPLLLAVFWGHGQLLRGSRSGLWMSMALAGAGLLAPILHGVLLLRGAAGFRTTASVTVLVLTGLVSLAQAGVAATEWRRGVTGERPVQPSARASGGAGGRAP